MRGLLRKPDLTVGKLQMQVVDKGFYLFQKQQQARFHWTHSPAGQRDCGVKLMTAIKK